MERCIFIFVAVHTKEGQKGKTDTLKNSVLLITTARLQYGIFELTVCRLDLCLKRMTKCYFGLFYLPI